MHCKSNLLRVPGGGVGRDPRRGRRYRQSRRRRGAWRSRRRRRAGDPGTFAAVCGRTRGGSSRSTRRRRRTDGEVGEENGDGAATKPCGLAGARGWSLAGAPQQMSRGGAGAAGVESGERRGGGGVGRGAARGLDLAKERGTEG